MICRVPKEYRKVAAKDDEGNFRKNAKLDGVEAAVDKDGVDKE
jgi:hypothetical protein